MTSSPNDPSELQFRWDPKVKDVLARFEQNKKGQPRDLEWYFDFLEDVAPLELFPKKEVQGIDKVFTL